ncbi:MAG: hypothetical protein P8046_08950 [Anaerolineales bacterium]
MAEQVQTTPQGGNKSLLLIIMAVIIVIALGVIAYLVLGTGSQLISGALGGGGEVPHDQFIVQMDDFVLRPADMEYAYNVDAGSDHRETNALFVSEFGTGYGKQFIQATGREDGWNIAMQRAGLYDFTPQYVQTRVSIYNDASGASTALSDEWLWAYNVESLTPDQVLDKSCSVGSDCISYMTSEAKAGAGAITERYDVVTRYKNVVIWVYASGQQGEVSEDVVLQYAQTMLDKVSTLDN